MKKALALRLTEAALDHINLLTQQTDNKTVLISNLKESIKNAEIKLSDKRRRIQKLEQQCDEYKCALLTKSQHINKLKQKLKMTGNDLVEVRKRLEQTVTPIFSNPNMGELGDEELPGLKHSLEQMLAKERVKVKKLTEDLQQAKDTIKRMQDNLRIS
jgi:uncharacterized coiled-coil DUF342 family protein